MRETSDVFDMALVTLMLVIMLGVCIWGMNTMRASSAITLGERTVLNNTYGQEVVAPVLTAKDALLSLVVADPYTTTPNTVLFKYGNSEFTTTLGTAFFKDQEASINAAWTAFFKSHMSATASSVVLDISNNRWVITLTE